MTKLSETLKKLIADEGLNTAELARATGILQPVMHRLTAGHTDNPRIDTLLPIAKYFKITVNQLVGEDPLPAVRKSDTETQEVTIQQKIPLLTQWHDIKKYLFNPSEKLSEIFIQADTPLSENTYALKVKDSTMLPRFTEQTTLIVDPELMPKNGDFVIVEHEETYEPTFKQVFFDSGDAYLKPLNTDFKTIFLGKNAQYKFLGVVVESRCLLKSSNS